MRKFVMLALLVLLPAGRTAAQHFIPGKDTLVMTVVREKHWEWTDQGYKPYAVWWVEDDNGSLVKILFITYFDDSNTGSLDVGCGKAGYLFGLGHFWNRFSISGCPDQPGELCSECPSCPHDYTLVDGITGCSEPNSLTDTTSITRMWDLTDRQGQPVAAGTYHLRYSAVFLDEEVSDQEDKTYGMTITLTKNTVDTTILAPADLVGTSSDASFVVKSMRVSFGGLRYTNVKPVSANDALVNIPPAAPTVSAPEPPTFCGNGAGLLGLGLVFVLANRSRKKKGHGRG